MMMTQPEITQGDLKMIKKFAVCSALLMLLSVPVMAQDQPAAAAPAVTAPAPQAAPVMKKKAKTSGSDEAGIKKLFESLTQAWAAGDAKALASNWVKDGSLINPFGQAAWNREDVEQVAGADILAMKGSTQTFDEYKVRVILPGGFALVDATATIGGMKGPDGTDAPTIQFHIYSAVAKRGDKWYFISLRPYAYTKLPTAADAMAAAAVPTPTAVAVVATPTVGTKSAK